MLNPLKSETPPKSYLPTAITLIAFVAYASIFIYSSSVLIDGRRWFCLFDDAMISMRYAWNLAAGNGLVWNPGERVEGFTNPGWTAIMAVVHLVDSRLNITPFYVQIISAFCLLLTIGLTIAIGKSIGKTSGVASILAGAIVALYFPLNFFSLMGMETGLLSLMITAALYVLVTSPDSVTFSPLPWLFLFLAVVVRLDAVVPLIAIAAGAWWIYPSQRRSISYSALVALVAGVSLQTLARSWYYGEWLPNTYYLKMGEVPLTARLGRGVFVTGRFLYNHLWPFYFILPFWLISYFRNRTEARKKIADFARSPLMIMLAAVLGQIVYSIYVGGDVWEQEFYANRFIVIIIPAFYILFAYWLVASLESWTPLKNSIRAAPMIWIAVLAPVFVVQSNAHPGFESAGKQAMFRMPLQLTGDAADFIRLSKVLTSSLPPDCTLAIDRAGTLPYFMPNYRFFDVLGKADRVIARQKSRSLQADTGLLELNFVPGHTKWDAGHTLGTLKPDIVLLAIGIMSEDYTPYLNKRYRALEIPGFFGSIYIKSKRYIELAPPILIEAREGFEKDEKW